MLLGIRKYDSNDKKKLGLGYVKKLKMNILKRDDFMKKIILGVYDWKLRYY